MFNHFENAADAPDVRHKSDFRDFRRFRRKNKSRSVIEVEEATEVQEETEVETSAEDYHIELQKEEQETDVYMDCSLFRACGRCTEIESSRIVECQTGGTGRITTFRCIATTTTTDVHSPNNDRETRSYQGYRKDDAYYNNNKNNDNLSMIDLSATTTALLPSSTIVTTPTFLYYYESCSYTKDEYEFNYIQFQVFICLLGIISIYSIRRQKMFAASLFDQRRMKNNTSTGTSTNATVATTTNVSRTNSTNNSSSRGVVIQRSNTGLMNHNSQNSNNNNDGNNVNSIEMKSLLSSGSTINDMDIV